jgi:hypothetical protein
LARRIGWSCRIRRSRRSRCGRNDLRRTRIIRRSLKRPGRTHRFVRKAKRC